MKKYQVMPPLSADEYTELKTDIEARGVLVPVEYDEHGEVLDGHHRVQICEELGITEWPRVVRLGLSEAGKLTHARQLNLARRHLDRAQKRELIAQQLRETPQLTDRQIARDLGADHKTVGTVRDELVESGEIPHFSERIDPRTGNASQPAERPSAYRYVDPSPAGQEAVLQSAKDVRAERAAEKREENDAKRRESVALPVPAGEYRTIVIDPPWPIEINDRDVRPGQVGMHYPTMSLEEIERFLIPAADGCIAFVWTTQKFLPATFEIVKAWGLNYLFTMVWHKPGGPQPFNLPQYNCEFIVVARKGGVPFLDTKQFFTCFNAQRREHSRKPDEFYDVVRRVTAEPRIDIFSREAREGFDQFGNETGKFAA